MKNNNNVVILAGGFGTRLSKIYPDIPKPLVPINGTPILEHQIKSCALNGFSNILLLLHYQSDKIIEYFGDGSEYNVNISYYIEEIPKGTAGALLDVVHLLASDVLVLYADTYFDIDLRFFYNYHLANTNDVTIFLHPNDHPADSDLVEINDKNEVIKIHSYPHVTKIPKRNLVNAALYCIKTVSLKDFNYPNDGTFDIAKHLFPQMLNTNLKLHGYISPEYIKDIGTPSRITRVTKDILSNVPDRLSLRQKRRAIFLDRDGTINEEINHLSDPKKLKLLPNVGHAIRLLNQNGFLSIVITNQPVVARGDVTPSQLSDIHAVLDTMLGEHSAYLDKIYYCPHHPDSGFPNEIANLKIDCDCRKPKTGMIDKALTDFNIDINSSWLIGDSTSDILAGKNANLKTILVRTGYAGRDGKYKTTPDFIFDSLFESVEWVLFGYERTLSTLSSIVHEIITNEIKFVLITGLSRSGKTTLSKVLCEMLVNMSSHDCHHIELDNWLKSPSMRVEGAGVLTRYDLDQFKKYFSSLMELDAFSKHSREYLSAPESSELTHNVNENDIFVIEGIPSYSLSDYFRNKKTLKIYIDITEELRLERFVNYYLNRGYSLDKINSLKISRELDENNFIKSQKDFSDHILSYP